MFGISEFSAPFPYGAWNEEYGVSLKMAYSIKKKEDCRAKVSIFFFGKAGALVVRAFNFVSRHWWGTVHIFSITNHVGHIQAEVCQRYNIVAVSI